jgi:hypothetical protein
VARFLQVLTGVCSVVFLLGTTLHNFAVVDTSLIETMMRRAGAADPAGEAPGFTFGFRIVGCVYMLGNALGVLAFRSSATWLFWLVIAVNLTQSLGFLMIPSDMWTVAMGRYGVVGILPSLITDGGAVCLVVVLSVASIRYRRPWARPGARPR